MNDQAIGAFLAAHPIPFLALALCLTGLLFLYILSGRTALQMARLEFQAEVERRDQEKAVAEAMERHEAIREEARQRVAEAMAGGRVGLAGSYSPREVISGRYMTGYYPKTRRFEPPPARPVTPETEQPEARSA